MEKDFKGLSQFYGDKLLHDVMPFWINHSLDHELGGYFTCLTREGQVFDTDKFLWLQNRELWMFSFLHEHLDAKSEWKDAACLGYNFLKKYGRASDGSWYFSVDRQGNPLIHPYNIFSDCFATMGFSQYAKMTGNDEAMQIAIATFNNILRRQGNPKGIWNKAIPGSRNLVNFSLPMILSNLVLLLKDVLPKDRVDQTVQECVNMVMNIFRDKDRGIIFENVLPNGDHHNSYEGRLINPGHGIESMWFIMDIAHAYGDTELMKQAVDTTISILEFGWDKDYEGIFYFLDEKGYPPLQLEWDQKLWWVHLETLISLSKAYLYTGDERCWEWYKKVHKYAWSHFNDDTIGEWFGYLNRQGNPLTTLKGSKWKGCFHLPRALYQCSITFAMLDKIQTKKNAV